MKGRGHGGKRHLEEWAQRLHMLPRPSYQITSPTSHGAAARRAAPGRILLAASPRACRFKLVLEHFVAPGKPHSGVRRGLASRELRLAPAHVLATAP